VIPLIYRAGDYVQCISSHIPEQNGQVESSFATLLGQLTAMWKASGPYELFYGKDVQYSKNLRIIGGIEIKIARAKFRHE
jgi:hypothetical protein